MITGLDHIVLAVRDVAATCDFYRVHLGIAAHQESPGKWSLHFGRQKISLQPADSPPALARNTVPGSGNFCLLTDEDVEGLAARLRASGVAIVAGPGERAGATGPVLSVYFHDPDGNLVEVATRL